MKIIKLSEGIGSYQDSFFSGQIPDPSMNIGTSSVDVSQLTGQFPNAQKSVELVNKYDPSLLKNIGYIFSFDNNSAYGVYLPGLNTEMHFLELKRELESVGYRVFKENGKFVAYPTDENRDITEEDIRKEIQNHYAPIKNRGGTVFGVNLSKTLSDIKELEELVKDSVDPLEHENLKNDLKIAYVAGVMAHEAKHAQQDIRSDLESGAPSQGEGPSEQVEKALLNNLLREVFVKYGLDPSSLKISSSNLKKVESKCSNWYKKAQHHPFYPPSGSDLRGRIGLGGENYQGQTDWGMLNSQYANAALEERLGRQFNSPLPMGLSQEHDSYELQLRKYTIDDWKLDPELIYEELLREGHVDENIGYKHVEELLEDERPKPLLMPIKKKKAIASKIIKEATLFGWYNNLEISNGSTIPGLGDRVMEWDDRDECFSEEEGWIRSQPRYNPTYDIKGFYYRWVEPRFKPELWDNYSSDISNIHPARRFASKINDIDDLQFIINSIRQIKSNIKSEKIKATRLICSEDLVTVIDGLTSDVDIKLFNIGEINDESILSVWIYKDVEDKDIEKAENMITNEDETVSDAMSKLIGCNSTLSDSIEEIMTNTKEILEEYEVNDIYAIGSYARERYYDNRYPEVEDLEFSSNNPRTCLKIGYLLAEKMGCEPRIVKDKKMLCFCFKGVRVCFDAGKRYDLIDNFMSENDIDQSSNLLHDLCNKDFTINARSYNPATETVTSIFKRHDESIKTVMEPNDAVSSNPMIILRAILLSLKHDLPIDKKLGEAMVTFSDLLLEKLDYDVINFAKKKIEMVDKKGSEKLFKKYKLEKIFLGV
jgi:hypothetical protein